MAAPAYGSAGTYLTSASGQTTANVAVPSSVAADDIIIVFLYKENGNTVTMPSGFTEVGTAPNTGDQWHHAFWKRATGADSGTYNFSWTGSVWRAATATRYTGCVTSGTPYDTGTGAPDTASRASSGTTTPAVSLTTEGADRLLVWSASTFNPGAWTPPSGFTERVDASDMLTVATKAQATAGATGSVTGTCATSDWQTAWLIALQPPSDVQADATATSTATITAAAAPNTATYVIVPRVFGGAGGGFIPLPP